MGLAGDGEEALLLVDEGLPDLILLDWMLPKASGIEVCRRLRQRNEVSETDDPIRTVRSVGYSLDLEG